MDWNVFILGVCSGAIYFNLKNFFNDDVNDGIIYNTIIFVLISLISIGKIMKGL